MENDKVGPVTGAFYVKVVFAICFTTMVCWSVCAAAEGDTAASFKTKRVVILIIDGPRFTETWGEAERRHIPNQNTKLAPQGVFFSNFVNAGPTYTNAGHTALVTGFHQEIDNRGKELPAHPTIFQYYLSKTGAPNTDAWIISTKDKLNILADTKDEHWNGKFVASFDGGKTGPGSGYRTDPETWEQIQKLLPQHKPHLVLVNFKEPDASGHARDWEKYLQGIRDTDELALKLWDYLQSLPDYAGQTALFITNDHGRHIDGRLDGFRSHGDDCSGCRHISLLAMGPDFKKGAVIETKRNQTDVAVTAAELLGLKLEGSAGEVLWELFENPPQKK